MLNFLPPYSEWTGLEVNTYTATVFWLYGCNRETVWLLLKVLVCRGTCWTPWSHGLIRLMQSFNSWDLMSLHSAISFHMRKSSNNHGYWHWVVNAKMGPILLLVSVPVARWLYSSSHSKGASLVSIYLDWSCDLQWLRKRLKRFMLLLGWGLAYYCSLWNPPSPHEQAQTNLLEDGRPRDREMNCWGHPNKPAPSQPTSWVQPKLLTHRFRNEVKTHW